jgi:hypothetical protein
MEKPSTARIALKWGFISAIVIVVYTIILYSTFLFKQTYLSWLSFIPLFWGIILAIREFKKINNNYVTISDGLNLGTLMSAVTGLISGISNFIYTNFINLNILNELNNIQREQMLSQGYSIEKVNQDMEMITKYSTPSIIFLTIFIGYIIAGFIFSLIVSAIVKHSKPEMEL